MDEDDDYVSFKEIKMLYCLDSNMVYDLTAAFLLF